MLAYNILTTKKKRKGGVKVNFLPVIIGVLLFSLFSDKGGGKQSGGSGNAIDMENIQNAVGAIDRKSTRLNSSHRSLSRMPSSA